MWIINRALSNKQGVDEKWLQSFGTWLLDNTSGISLHYYAPEKRWSLSTRKQSGFNFCLQLFGLAGLVGGSVYIIRSDINLTLELEAGKYDEQLAGFNHIVAEQKGLSSDTIT